MRKNRFSDEQKVQVLREGEATSVDAVAKKCGTTAGTIYEWRCKYGGMDALHAGRLL